MSAVRLEDEGEGEEGRSVPIRQFVGHTDPGDRVRADIMAFGGWRLGSRE